LREFDTRVSRRRREEEEEEEEEEETTKGRQRGMQGAT